MGACKAVNNLVLSYPSSPTALLLVHSSRATVDFLLALQQTSGSCLKLFALAVPTSWNTIPPKNCLAHSFTSSRYLLKCFFSIRSILIILRYFFLLYLSPSYISLILLIYISGFLFICYYCLLSVLPQEKLWEIFFYPFSSLTCP